MLAFSRCLARIGATINTSRKDGRKMPMMETSDPQKPPHQIADEGGRDHHWSRTDHADHHSDEELPLIEPVILLHKPLLEKRHDDEAAAERQRTRLQEKQ